MTKQHFIALADRIRHYNTHSDKVDMFDVAHIELLADFCQEQNPNFNRERWLSYIKGECGSNGGKIQKYEYEVQGNYGSWECVTTEDTRQDALIRLAEYRANERGTAFRVAKVKVESVNA